MSLWDQLKKKPSVKQAVVTAVDVSPDRREVSLGWSDGRSTRVLARTLRQNCPCAGCVDEMSGKRTLDVTAIPEETTVNDIAPVGNYALCFTFSDNHNTGLYVWDSLREMST